VSRDYHARVGTDHGRRSIPAERIDTERIRQQHPIADIVERYGIQLRRAASVLVGRCPFNTDGDLV
jgi:hypothetical protein